MKFVSLVERRHGFLGPGFNASRSCRKVCLDSRQCHHSWWRWGRTFEKSAQAEVKIYRLSMIKYIVKILWWFETFWYSTYCCPYTLFSSAHTPYAWMEKCCVFLRLLQTYLIISCNTITCSWIMFLFVICWCFRFYCMLICSVFLSHCHYSFRWAAWKLLKHAKCYHRCFDFHYDLTVVKTQEDVTHRICCIMIIRWHVVVTVVSIEIGTGQSATL